MGWLAVLWAPMMALVAVVMGAVGCGREAPADQRTGGEQGSGSGSGGGGGGAARVAVLSPAAAVILRDLGHEELIVARHAYDLALDRALPVCGDQAGLDYEALLRARPTVVVTEWGARELPARLRELSQRKGWQVHDVRLLSLRDIGEQAVALDALVRGGEPSPGALDLESRVRAWGEGRPPKRLTGEEAARIGSVLLLGAASPPGALGPGSCHHELLVALGVTPAITEGKAWIELTHEDIVRLAPGAIVVFRPRAPGEAGNAEVAMDDGVLRGLMDLDAPAMTSKRVLVIDDPLGLLPSTSMLGVGGAMAEGLAALAGE
jgi:ABC-type hemin transport system substrate-binding protein